MVGIGLRRIIAKSSSDVTDKAGHRPAGVAIFLPACYRQQHTMRGAIAGALKETLGLAVVSEKIEGRARVYRIV